MVCLKPLRTLGSLANFASIIKDIIRPSLNKEYPFKVSESTYKFDKPPYKL